jgi:hypothetical protein
MRGKKAAFIGMRGKREEETAVEQKKRAGHVQERIKHKDYKLSTCSLLSGYCREVNRYLKFSKRRQNMSGFVEMRGRMGEEELIQLYTGWIFVWLLLMVNKTSETLYNFYNHT